MLALGISTEILVSPNLRGYLHWLFIPLNRIFELRYASVRCHSPPQLNTTGFLWMTVLLLCLLSAKLSMLFLPHLPWWSHTRCTNTCSFRLTHNSCTHVAVCCQCLIDPLADSCLHMPCYKGSHVITQSMLGILFTFPKRFIASLQMHRWRALCSCVPAKINRWPLRSPEALIK